MILDMVNKKYVKFLSRALLFFNKDNIISKNSIEKYFSTIPLFFNEIQYENY